jgi:hypothetical protein
MTTHRLLHLLTKASAAPSGELRIAVALLSSEFPDTPRIEIESALLAAQKATEGTCSRIEMFSAARALLRAPAAMAAA